MEKFYGTWYQSGGSFSLINVGSGFHCLHNLFSYELQTLNTAKTHTAEQHGSPQRGSRGSSHIYTGPGCSLRPAPGELGTGSLRGQACPGSRFNWQVVEDSIGLVCCSWVSWWGGQLERRERSCFWGFACVLCSLFCSAALVLLALLVL